MTMVMISPSRREVSPAEQLYQSPRLVPPRFRLVAAEFRPVSLPMIFFLGKSLHIAEDGHRRAIWGPRRQGVLRLELALVVLEEERVMQHSSVSISLSF